MSPPPGGVSFIIPVFNALRFLPDSIGSVRRALASAGEGELIVLDNGSTDGSWAWLQRELGRAAALVQLPGRTVAGLRNEGAKLATRSLLAFVDADCVVPDDYVRRACDALDRTGAAGTGSRYALPPDPKPIEQAWHELHELDRDGPVSYINSGNLVIQAAAFHAVGGFDESLITGEDAELGQRLHRAGFMLHEVRSVSTVHLGNPTSIGHFFRKQRWHSLGMMGTVDLRSFDRPTLMTILQLAGYGLAAWALCAGPGGPAGRAVLASAGVFTAPIAAVVFRLATGGRTRRPFLAVFLYLLYFTARITALGDLVRTNFRKGLLSPSKH